MVSSRFLLIPAFCLAWLLAFAEPAAADPVSNLYAADVAVTDQSPATRTSALQDALAQVLVKVTGSQAVLQTAEAGQLLENPSRYLQQYRYENIRPAPIDPAAPKLALHVEFDGTTIERRLRAAGLPLWGRERPLTLAWVAVNADGRRQLLGADHQEPIAEALHRTARRRGLPLQLPRLDTEDTTRVSFMDVWGVFEDPLLRASERYGVDAVLAGSISRTGENQWAGRWTLLRNGERQRWELGGPTPETVAVTAIDALAEHYAKEFAVYAPIGGEGRAVVEIHAVSGLAAYADVQAYLQGLSMVNDLRLLAVEGDVLRFEIDISGTLRTLEQAIALGRMLEPMPRETVVPLGRQLYPPLTSEGLEPAAAEEEAVRYRYLGSARQGS